MVAEKPIRERDALRRMSVGLERGKQSGLRGDS
jgi:hypothetical protein